MRRYFFNRPVENNNREINWIPLLFSLPAFRSCFVFDAYITPSKNHVGLLPKNASQLCWIEKYKDNITYHAAWRANLFFLMLIASYKRERLIQVAATKLQYGKGASPYIQACHSSPFPSLSDRDLHEDRIRFRQTCLFKKSFLLHWNSMTVGCPNLVNEFDSFLEGRGSGSVYRRNLLFALNQCSMGTIDPVTGMQFFYLVMSTALKERDLFLKKCEPWERKAARRVITLQKKGMFRHATKTYRPKKDYQKTILDWDGDKKSFQQACLKTQAILLQGDEKVGGRFLKRFDF